MQAGLLPVEWVLARSLCRFASFDFATLDKARRADALRLAITEWSPFPATGHAAVWSEGVASVWAWDSRRVSEAQARLGVARRKPRVVPETLLHASMTDGAALLACIEGCEGQVWRNGRLAHSRWWPATPELTEWRQFLRDAGLPEAPNMPLPPLEPIAWLARSWAKPVASVFGGLLSANAAEPLLAGIVAVGLGLAAFWQAAQWQQLDQGLKGLEQELQAEQEKVSPVVTARNEALDRRAAVETLSRFDVYSGQLALLARIAELLPKDALLREWEYDRGRLKFVIEPKAPLQSSQLVQVFQSEPAFAEVQVQSGLDVKLMPFSLVLKPGGTF